MYKYTADSSVIHKFNCLKKKPRGYDKVFDFALSVVGDSWPKTAKQNKININN